jgi:4-hydroxy-tetrahydrodipicolinate synthase
MKDILTGTGVALITPFLADGEIDWASLEKIIRFQIGNGANYLVVMGTTGETATLSADEKVRLAAFVRETTKGSIPLVYGLGGNDTAENIRNIRQADFTGYSALLSVTPYYNKPQQEGLFRHFMAVAEASPLPVILYNVPGRTGVNMLPETTLKLTANSSKFCAIKEASGNLDQITKILMNRPDGFLMLSGDDNLTLHMMALGAEGVISVVANVLPAPFSSMVNHCLKGDYTSARALHFKMFDFTNLLFANGSPAGAKAALASLGYCHEVLRLPLVPVNDETRAKIRETIKTQFTNPL